jgi:hypothetical protein
LIFILCEKRTINVGKGRRRKENEPLLRFLQPTALVAGELVALTEHFGSAELPQAGGDGSVLLDVDGKVEESFVSRRNLQEQSD